MEGMARFWMVTLALALGAGGCGGESSGGSAGGVNPPAVSTRPTGTGILQVHVRDAFGSAVSGAEVSVSTSGGTGLLKKTTDGTGLAEFQYVAAGSVFTAVQGPDSAAHAQTMVRAGRSNTLELTTLPVSSSAGGIVRSWLPEGATSADGRTLEIALQISDVPGVVLDGQWDPWVNDGVRLEPCLPDIANDHPAFRADCVSGPDGFDASYTVAGSNGSAMTIERLPETTQYWDLMGAFPTPFQAVLLLDQSDSAIRDDPADHRLLAARYLLNDASGDFSVVLGAFAADIPVDGRLSQLPQQPVTFFPVENPQFTNDGQGYFSTVDLLETMEGGASALYGAVDRAIDLHESFTFTGKRTIVVLTDGNDQTCGAPADCRARRQAVVEKSRATGVAIVTIGYDGGLGTADLETLGLLTQAAPGGASFWVDKPRQLPATMRTVRNYLAELKPTVIVTFRIESPEAGTFASGRTVLGRVKYADECPFDCNYVHIPLAVAIP